MVSKQNSLVKSLKSWLCITYFALIVIYKAFTSTNCDLFTDDFNIKQSHHKLKMRWQLNYSHSLDNLNDYHRHFLGGELSNTHHLYKRESQESQGSMSTQSPEPNTDRLLERLYSGYSVDLNSLDTPLQNTIQLGMLHSLGIEKKPSLGNISNMIKNSGSMYIQNLYRRFGVREQGRFLVDSYEATIQVKIYDPRLDKLVNRDEKLTFSTQEAINRSDTIVSCTVQDLSLHKSLRTSMSFEIGSSISRTFGPKTPVLGAQLRIFVNHSRSLHKNDPFTVAINTDDTDIIVESRTQVPAKHNGWITLNVTSAVEQLAQANGTKLKLHLRRLADDVRSISEFGILNAASVPPELQPFLIIYLLTKDVPTRQLNYGKTPAMMGQYMDANLGFSEAGLDGRHRRSAITNKEKTYKNYNRTRVKNVMQFCHKVTWNVSFKAINWSDWIIAPDNYDASYCSGECPFPLPPHINSTNHAIIQMLAHLMDKQIPKPCCAPTKLQPITVLYYDDFSNVVLKEYQGMIVQQCGCI